MSFLVLLLMIWVEKMSAWRRRIQHDGPWLRQLARVENGASSASLAWGGLFWLVLLPVLLLGLLILLLKPLAYGWLLLPVHLAVLVYSLGRGDLLAALGPLRDAWRRGDGQAVYHVAERDLGLSSADERGLLLDVQGYLVWQAYQSFFAVIFWYALLGPLVALAYRLLAMTAEHAREPGLRERADRLRHALDWLPARALAASFALVGNFVAVGRALLQDLLSWELDAPRLVASAGRAATGLPEPTLDETGVASLDELWQLLVRAAMLWYAVFALWTLLL
ncbi:MAG: regulatory signaling modulator protein AmpE [Pseudomonas sp.]|uniref:regulatory signaling modulator protein AmpE n=1 Tax=Pseudomonas sp. TaxID=306 RepID=UPI0033942B9B